MTLKRAIILAAFLFGLGPSFARAQPCALTVPTGASVTLANGTFNHCSVDVQAGATLVIGGAVTLDVTGSVNIDGLVTGDGNGYGSVFAPGLGLGAALSGGGGGHGGMGGGGAGSGGVTYDSPIQPTDMGSQGGAALPGFGGAALILRSGGGVTVNGIIRMDGASGGILPNAGGRTGGGGGAGGTIAIDAVWIVGGGSLSVQGGGGTATITPVLGNFHGGGGGGLIRLCAANGVPFAGTHTEAGGQGGMPLPPVLVGLPGNFYECPPPALSPTPTATPVCPEGLRSPLNQFQPSQGAVTLSFNACFEGNYDLSVYNTAGEQVRKLHSGKLTVPAAMDLPWDGRNEAGEECASGVYLLRLTKPLGTELRKILLVR